MEIDEDEYGLPAQRLAEHVQPNRQEKQNDWADENQRGNEQPLHGCYAITDLLACHRSPDHPITRSQLSVVRADLRLPHSQLLVFVLQLIELPVNAAMRQQLLVVADLAHLAFVHGDDLIGSLNRREPVRD